MEDSGKSAKALRHKGLGVMRPCSEKLIGTFDNGRRQRFQGLLRFGGG
jgi:hypothetical protein